MYAAGGALLLAGIVAAALNEAIGLGGAAMADTALPALGETILVGAAVAICLRAVLVRRDRAAWAALGAGTLAWTGGDVYRLIAFPPGTHRYFPSPADAGYLLLYPCAYAGLWLLIRSRAARFKRGLWLDGLIGAAGVGAVGAWLTSAIVARTGGSFSTVATNVAYPLADVLTIAQLVAAMALSRWRPGRKWKFIGVGLATFAVADAAYAYSSAMGHTYVVAIGPLWVLAFVLIALGAWQRDRPALEPPLRLDGARALVVPLVFAVLATGLLAYGQRHALPLAGAILATATLLLVIVRTALTFRENLALLDSRRASLTDELTDLPNRRRLDQRIGWLASAREMPALAGLLLADLDRFKELNDTLGHHAGDLLLRSAGERFAELPGLDLVARLGGDEFAFVVTGEERRARLSAAASALHAALERPFAIDGFDVHVRASIGGALYGVDGEDAAELLQRADVAMYKAKEAGSGFELYSAERDPYSRERLRALAELRVALAEGELLVHYQPQADLRTGRVCGAEALVRWQHPTRGLLAPGAFLELAESGGLMRRLTSYVLERAIARCASWRAEGLELRMAVNLAMPNLLDPQLPEEVARLLEQARVPASQLVLEITENVVMADPVRILDVLGRLHALGVRLSLDDFGAGASSLGVIRRLPVDELKIDRSFVMRMDGDDDDATIVRATVELAHNLGLRVVAEGVETVASLKRLRALGCDEIQGYLLGRPVAAEELAARVREAPALAGIVAPAAAPARAARRLAVVSR